MGNVTPMMQQYLNAKQQTPDAVLLFRMGDFYELFYDDAKIAAEVLGIALTSREKGENAIPMAGFPHPALENYLDKLIRAGYRVAIADQVEDPKLAKGLVKREITRIVTAGTLTDEGLLDPQTHNYLAAIAWDKRATDPASPCGLAWIDLSTGQFYASEVPLGSITDELARIDPVEILFREDGPRPNLAPNKRCTLTARPPWEFDPTQGREALAKQFGTKNLAGFGWEHDTLAIGAAAAVLHYLQETQRANLGHIDRLLPYQQSETMQIDEATRASLELTRTMREGRRDGALIGVLDRTSTASGSRLLAEWLANPLTDPKRINDRLDAVEELIESQRLIGDLQDLLKRSYDLERLLAKVNTGRANPRDLGNVTQTLQVLPKIKAKLTGRKCRRLSHLERELDLCPQLRAELEEALAEECPVNAREGNLIRSGFSEELDSLRELASGGRQWIAEYQQSEIDRTGLTKLKIGFNKVQGYYLEVPNTQREKVPDDYIRTATTKNAERYYTPALKEYQEKVLTAEDQAKELEYSLFLELRDAVAEASRRLQDTARILAELDVLCCLATIALQRSYCRPQLVEQPVLEISAGRHPVLDARSEAGSFVPNDSQAHPEKGQLLLITGPNMAGKSTYIRQVALITLMAQIGSYVPATQAKIGIADRIFARVGASDEISRGQSTFMVEMTETARILHHATERSLVILDEIGRGTSTYDGVSLAWAIVEHLHQHTRCRTFFATHYHELTSLAEELQRVENLSVSVQEWQNEVVFLHKIVPGAAHKSYGLHVAKLAGVPPSVIQRAAAILADLESDPLHKGSQHPKPAVDSAAIKLLPLPSRPDSGPQRSLFSTEEHPLIDCLRELDLEGWTPEQALRQLLHWQQELQAEDSKTS